MKIDTKTALKYLDTDTNEAFALSTQLRKARADGHTISPIGASNSKTGVVSTYREVGATCPQHCPYLDEGCYAQNGNVRLHQRRANAAGDLMAAAVALRNAAITGTQARLHVSGDFGGGHGDPDPVYITGLIKIANKIRAKYSVEGSLAWTYTHFGETQFADWRARLHAAGIVVLWSDRIAPGGAIVESHDVTKARPKTDRVTPCPAQTHGITCAACKLCPNAFDLGLTISFDPHGSQSVKAKKAARLVRQRQIKTQSNKISLTN